MRDKCILPFLITERLEFFQLTQADLPELEILLGDTEIMYAWEHGFTKIESQAWLNENLRRYSSDGYSYWAVRKKNDGSLIGVMGILKEVAEGKQYIGIGYILNKKYWGQGYAGKELRLCVNMLFVNCSCKRLRRRSGRIILLHSTLQKDLV